MRSHKMRAEYDFSKAARGKFHRTLDKGYTVYVKESDGTEVVDQYILAENSIRKFGIQQVTENKIRSSKDLME